MNYAVNVRQSVDAAVVDAIIKKMEQDVYRRVGIRMHRLHNNNGVDVILYFYTDPETEYPLTAVEGLTQKYLGVEYYLCNNEQALAVRMNDSNSLDSDNEDTIAHWLSYIISNECCPITELDHYNVLY